MAEKTILIVDYDSQSLEFFVKTLKSPKVQIIEATDGQMAYEKFKEDKPDLVILEAILPKIHGFDLTKKINQESKGSVPVIIVTGLYRGPQYRHEALFSFGASEYFEKPVNPERFAAAVQEFLREEEDIEDELPSSDSVFADISKRFGEKPAPRKEKSSKAGRVAALEE
jgi:DNA-binding response OmpR family regulator